MKKIVRIVAGWGLLILGVVVTYFAVYGLMDTWDASWVWVLTQGVALTNLSHAVITRDNTRKAVRLWLIFTAWSTLFLYQGQYTER